MTKKPSKPADPRTITKSTSRRTTGLDAPRTKPRKRINDKKPKQKRSR